MEGIFLGKESLNFYKDKTWDYCSQQMVQKISLKKRYLLMPTVIMCKESIFSTSTTSSTGVAVPSAV